MIDEQTQDDGYDKEVEEDEVYIQYDIATYPSDFTLQTLLSMWEEGDIVVPDFQRNYVWSLKQASLLVESFLLGLPVPPVFFYKEDGTGKSLVIDGQQRIRSIIYFFSGYWGSENLKGNRRVFRLSGLSQLSPYRGKTFNELDESDRRKLQNSVLRALNTQQLNPRENDTSVYHIFERLNTGGTVLRPQEIRNCTFRGQLVSDLDRLNETPAWRLILRKPNPEKFQSDKEMILRIFALSHYSKLQYESPLKEFLNKVMRLHRNANSEGWQNFSSLFEEACVLITRELGDSPFSQRGRLNRSTMDAVFCVLLNSANKTPVDFNARFRRLINDENFIEITQQATLSKKNVLARLEKAKECLIE